MINKDKDGIVATRFREVDNEVIRDASLRSI